MRRRVVVTLLALLSTVVGSFTAASAQARTPTPKPQYVALGDSYASGAGLLPYSNAGCYRSASQAYPSLLAGRKFDLTFPACSGATTSTMLATQLASVSGAAYVTVTIGGNDVGFSTVLSDCVDSLFTDGCTDATKTATSAALTDLAQRLPSVLSQVRAAYPQARVLVSGYPVMFGEFTSPTCVVGTTVLGNLWVTRADAQWLNDSAARLNGVIRQAAAAAGATYVDAAATFDGHGRCDTGSPWVNGVVLNSLFPLQANERSFHPTAEGQNAGYRTAFLAAGFPK